MKTYEKFGFNEFILARHKGFYIKDYLLIIILEIQI